MTSSKYVVRNLWNKAPVLTTNLVDIGLVDAKFNENLTKAAVASFDEYVSIHQGGGGKSRSSPPSSSVSAGTRRRQRTSLSSPSNPGSARPKLSSINISGDDGNNLTENDFFFEHQKTRGYRLATDAIATCERTERLQEDYLVEIVAYYLKHSFGAEPLANLLMLGTGELSIDMWAAVQRGKGAYHADHVHEGALVSGVYYASVPPGSAPLVLKRPKSDMNSQVDIREEPASTEVDSCSDVILPPSEGNLVLFPPWVEHGVPLVEEQPELDCDNLPRVSYAFNVTAAIALGDDPWNVTRIQ